MLGPAGGFYLIDRHHLMKALSDEGRSDALVKLTADFSHLAGADLWSALEDRGWCHPYDADGRRRPFGAIPSTLDALRDDPHRSLASALRRAGGFAKKATPYSEFAWADFLRRRISPTALALDFDRALQQALRLAGMAAARDLPGWRSDRNFASGGRASSPSRHAAG